MNLLIKILLLTELTFIIFIAQTSSMSKEEEHEFIQGILGACRDKEHGSENDMRVLGNLQVPESREGKCMLACVLETVGIVSKKIVLSPTKLFIFIAPKYF